eukprot:2485888-Rhodomonas_salina.1
MSCSRTALSFASKGLFCAIAVRCRAPTLIRREQDKLAIKVEAVESEQRLTETEVTRCLPCLRVCCLMFDILCCCLLISAFAPAALTCGSTRLLHDSQRYQATHTYQAGTRATTCSMLTDEKLMRRTRCASTQTQALTCRAASGATERAGDAAGRAAGSQAEARGGARGGARVDPEHRPEAQRDQEGALCSEPQRRRSVWAGQRAVG